MRQHAPANLIVVDHASAESTTFTLRTTVSEDGKTMTGIGSDGSVQVLEKQ